MATADRRIPNSEINHVLLQLTRRAEQVDRQRLIETFVDVGPLFTLLSLHDHQVFYGRRGTGKTHALTFLGQSVSDRGDIPVYIDMRTIGSTGGMYSDPTVAMAERATRLLCDTLCAIHDSLLQEALDRDQVLNLGELGPRLDEFAEAITEVKVVGEVETDAAKSVQRNRSSDLSIAVGTGGIDGRLSAGDCGQEAASLREIHRGKQVHRVHFGAVGKSMRRVCESLGGGRLWVLIDEWSSVRSDMQPYLADLVRRSLLPCANLTVKIAAIEQRSTFQIALDDGDYLGIELGADVQADVNLDDFMVFDNSADRAIDFFRELLFRHFKAIVDPDAHQPRNARDLQKMAFTQRDAFEEFVRASEGVPRDAINILSLAVQRGIEDPVSKPNIRAASQDWYQRDKEKAVSANERALDLLNWIIDNVIAHRRARAFLLRSNVRSALVDALFDARVLHLLKRNIASPDEPGVRYVVYKIDFGCYVDLLESV